MVRTSLLSQSHAYRLGLRVVNDSPTLRTYDIAPDAAVYGSIRLTGVPESSERNIDDWMRFLSSGSRALAGQDVAEQVGNTFFHFQIESGRVVGIEEQYRP